MADSKKETPVDAPVRYRNVSGLDQVFTRKSGTSVTVLAFDTVLFTEEEGSRFPRLLKRVA